jgi:uncharacterized protein YjbI with pentapeptide repeats
VEQPQAYGEGYKVNENKSSHETQIGVALLAGLVLIALVLALIAGVEWYLNPASKLSIVERRNLVQGLASAGQALAVFLTGAVGLIGLFFTWQNTRQARESTQRTLELTERGQITERFTRAIDQLGGGEGEKNSPEIRLGGIYALERIAKESKKDYYGVVMEVLTAYVRQHAPRQQTEVLSEQCIIGKNPSAPYPRSDIRAILTIIGRRDSYDDNAEEAPLDLHETDLHGAQLRNANLGNAIFVGADLRGTYLVSVDLTSANLYRADLSGAILAYSDFGEAQLRSVDLRWADLEEANLRIANLEEADLQDANLRGADLQDANLQRANLQRANLQGAKVADEQLADTLSLKGATMPDGSERP